MDDISMSDGVEIIGAEAFYNTAYYNDSENWENEAFYIGEYLVKVSETAAGEFAVRDGTKYICSYAFGDCVDLTDITVPESVIKIYEYAFYGCSGLESITLPFIGGSRDDLTGYSAVFGYIFGCVDEVSEETTQQWYNGGVGSYYIPQSLTVVTVTDGDIKEGAFNNCESIVSIALGDNVTAIGNDAFSYCRGLKDVTLGSGITYIGEWIFKDCDSIEDIVLPENITYISTGAFSDCDGLGDIIISDNVTSIGDWAFYGCDGIESITVSDNTTYIGAYAFYMCSNLSDINLTDEIISIGEKAFCDTVFYNDEANWDGGSLYIDKYLIKVNDAVCGEYVINENIKAIADDAFYGCDGITDITICDEITHIGKYAFYDCDSLVSITIPAGVKKIGDWAFSECDTLKSVIIKGSEISVGDYAFSGWAF